MRRVFVFVITSFAMSAHAIAAGGHASKDTITALTKQLAAKYCSPHAIGYGERIAGCTYSKPFFLDGTWNVFVRYRMIDKNGKPEYAQGAESIYVFDKSDKFVKILPGM